MRELQQMFAPVQQWSTTEHHWMLILIVSVVLVYGLDMIHAFVEWRKRRVARAVQAGEYVAMSYEQLEMKRAAWRAMQDKGPEGAD